MRRPGIATIASIGLHAAVVALALIPWPRKDPPVMVSSVPVSIVSSEVAAAAPADNPSDEQVDVEALEAIQDLLETEAQMEEIPEVPIPPQPRPPEPSPERAETRRPDPTPTPRPSQTPPEKARPQQPPRPSQNRPDPGLDLDALAEPRPRTQQQRPTGQSGAGQAPRATGSQIANLGGQVTRHWILNCDLDGMRDLSIPVRVTITSSGRISSGPTVTDQRSGATWRTASEAMLRAVRAAEPFEVPNGFETQEINFRFRADQACANR
jgi:outer membrane biosynthesis protein TonB